MFFLTTAHYRKFYNHAQSTPIGACVTQKNSNVKFFSNNVFFEVKKRPIHVECLIKYTCEVCKIVFTTRNPCFLCLAIFSKVQINYIFFLKINVKENFNNFLFMYRQNLSNGLNFFFLRKRLVQCVNNKCY